MEHALPIEIIRLILILMLLAATILGMRIYWFNTGKRLNRVSAASLLAIAVLAYVEYEITHIDEVSAIRAISIFHSAAAVLLVFFGAWSARLFSWDQKRFPRWFWDISLTLLGLWTLIVLFALFFTSFNPDYGHYLSSSGRWKYYLTRQSFFAYAFHGILLFSTLFMSFCYLITYVDSKKPHRKRWGLLLFLTYTIMPIILLYVFIFRIGEASQGDYLVSPFLAIYATMTIWIYTNFKIFEISPTSAVYHILESMSNLVLIVDEDFIIKFSNRALTRNFDIPPEQIRGFPLGTLLTSIQMDNWEERLEELKLIGKGERYEAEFTTFWNEKTQHFLAISSPVFNATNYKTGYVIVATDLTKSKVAELQLREYARELEQSNKELEQFAYIASHDLKSPLRNITSFVNLLERKIQPVTDPDIKDYLEFITKSSKYMYTFIQNVLEYSLVKKKANNLTCVQLDDILSDILESNQSLLKESNTIIERDPLPSIQSNPFLMQQLFQNLINNGIKYNKARQPHIKIKCELQNGQYIFSVQDNGIGIEPIYQEQIFNMFKRLNADSYYEGSGIGLAICKRIVQLHNGDIWVNSQFEEGSTFYFTLGQ